MNESFLLSPTNGRLKNLNFGDRQFDVLVNFVSDDLIKFVCEGISIQKHRKKLKCVKEGNEFHIKSDGMLLKLNASVQVNGRCFYLLAGNEQAAQQHRISSKPALGNDQKRNSAAFINTIKAQRGPASNVLLKHKTRSGEEPTVRLFARTYGSSGNPMAYGGHNPTPPRPIPTPLPVDKEVSSASASPEPPPELSPESSPGLHLPVSGGKRKAAANTSWGSVFGSLPKAADRELGLGTNTVSSVSTPASPVGTRGLFTASAGASPSISTPRLPSVALVTGGKAGSSGSSSGSASKSRPSSMTFSGSKLAAAFGAASASTDVFSFEGSSDGTVSESEFRWRGIRNLGNTCYAASIVQAVFGITGFTDALCALYQDVGTPASPGIAARAPMLSAFMRLLAQHQSNGDGDSLAEKSLSIFNRSSSRVALDMAPLQAAVFRLNKQFTTHKQHDAHEYLISFLELIHCQARVLVSSPAPASFVCPVINHFEFQIKNSISCQLCGHVSVTREPYRDLSLDHVPAQGEEAETEAVPLSSLVRSFFAPEFRDMRCDKCSHTATGTATETPSSGPASTMRAAKECSSLPRYLLLHLKRFHLDIAVGTVMKLSYPVSVPPTLDLGEYYAPSSTPRLAKKPRTEGSELPSSPIVIGTSSGSSGTNAVGLGAAIGSNDDSTRYALRSVVRHIGANAVSGHYITDVCSLRGETTTAVGPEEASDTGIAAAAVGPVGRWRRCDDSVVKAVSERDVCAAMQHTPYLIIYERL